MWCDPAGHIGLNGRTATDERARQGLYIQEIVVVGLWAQLLGSILVARGQHGKVAFATGQVPAGDPARPPIFVPARSFHEEGLVKLPA